MSCSKSVGAVKVCVVIGEPLNSDILSIPVGSDFIRDSQSAFPVTFQGILRDGTRPVIVMNPSRLRDSMEYNS